MMLRKDKLLYNLEEIEELVKYQNKIISRGELPNHQKKDSRVLKIISLLLNTGIFPFTINNKVEVYVDGNEKFSNLIEDIRKAKDHIHLEYFIIKDSEIGRQIKSELIKKAKEGIKIRIIYDDVGCWRFWFIEGFLKK